MRKKVLTIYFWIFASGLAYLLLLELTQVDIPCFYLETTGLKCGGCGITRMFLSMARLDFVSAFRYNPVAFVLFFVWNTVGLLCAFEKTKIVKRRAFIFTLLGISMTLIVLFGVIRNII